jgi:uncharacterized protein YkwD
VPRSSIALLLLATAAVILSANVTTAFAGPLATSTSRNCLPTLRCRTRVVRTHAPRAHSRRAHRRNTHPLLALRRRAQRVAGERTLAVAGLARESTIERVLAASCANTALVPEPANLPLVRTAVLCLVNHERASHGEPPLTLNTQLEKAAEGHNQEMISLDYFEHVSPSGLTPVGRIRNTTPYIPSPKVGYVIGENLAWGTLSLATPQAIVEAWIASPGHLANILESRYRETGVGVVASVPAVLSGGQHGATYAQEFGVIIH